jgi:hypothetical protein
VGADRTRIVRLDAGHIRDDAYNTKTGIMIVEERPVGRSFQSLFLLNYEQIRRIGSAFAQPGLAVIAIDSFTARVAGSICIAAKAAKPNLAIVGRHSMADLFLESDPSLSLRHLAVVVEPMSEWARHGGDLRYRLLDLRTRLAFEDEDGRTLEGVVAEGPIFVRCGHYALLCLITGDETDWPSDAEQAWACIPPRVYLDETEAEPDRWRRQRRARTPARGHPVSEPGGAIGDRVTRVQRTIGPWRLRAELLLEGEPPLGTLRVRATSGSQAITIGGHAASQGILLGRYDRCDASDATVLTDPNISRVHLLLLQVGRGMFAFDVVSTNGTWQAESVANRPALAEGTQHDIDDGFMWREVRIAELTPQTYLALGEGLAYLSWSPV